MSTSVNTLPAPHLGDARDITADTTNFTIKDLDNARAYYEENGYVVLRDAVDDAMCDQVNESFDTSVKQYGGFLYRQTTCDPERNRFGQHGHVMNPVLNVQDLPTKHFSDFRTASLDAITSPDILKFVAAQFGEPGRLVQSMYFEGNPATWAHQDTYYLDAEVLGTMIAAWIATEDISVEAGRFYVYRGSHRANMFRNGGKFDVAFNHDRYKDLVLSTISELKLECVAPALQAGDVLLWNSQTIHGSLLTNDDTFSRRSLTAHFMPESQRFLQHQSRIRPMSITKYGVTEVHSPKSLDNYGRRAVLKVETGFPKAFKLAKRVATKASIAVRRVKGGASNQ